MGSPDTVTVYVYDANDLVRAGLRGLIDEEHGLLVVGSSGTEAQALADIIRLRPAVAVLGGSLGDDQALPLCRRRPRLGTDGRLRGAPHRDRAVVRARRPRPLPAPQRSS